MEDTGEKERNLKRGAESQVPGEGPEQQQGNGSSEAGDSQPAKKPALSSSFSFRPSPLHKATQGLILRQSSLTPPSSIPGSCTASVEKATSSKHSPQVGFLKLDNSELKPVLVSSSSPSSSSTATTNGREALNHTETKTGSFTSFIQSASSAVPTFSSLSSMSSTSFGSSKVAVSDGEKLKKDGELGGNGGDGEVESRGDEREPESKAVAGTSVPVLLPEVERVTGEEGEKKIVQINAKLYVFDAPTHSWKERGRGDIRLNDACQREGVFQSRLVMRASGSYRLLLNTHLWAEMKCDRANQKSIRITGQDGESIAVFLITGNNKDIQQLFSAIDHRVEALRLNAQHSSSSSNEATSSEKETQSRPPCDSSPPSDEEDKESTQGDTPSSPESSDETHTSDFRQKAVLLPSEGSECEGESGKTGEGGEDTGEAKESEKSKSSCSTAVSGTN